MKRRTIWEWACEYTGDPGSFGARGEMMLSWLRELGLRDGDSVLDIGCGNLSQGIPLIQRQHPGCYVGLEPNGWLVEAALVKRPVLLERDPTFLYRSDFDASSVAIDGFGYAISHSVLSHAAHWQLELMLTNVRKVMQLGGKLLVSLRLADDDDFARDWVYPGNSHFRLSTVKSVGYHVGWEVRQRDDLRRRLVKVAPNDVHDWLELTAVESADARNELRLGEEARTREAQEILAIATEEHKRRCERELAVLRGEE